MKPCLLDFFKNKYKNVSIQFLETLIDYNLYLFESYGFDLRLEFLNLLKVIDLDFCNRMKEIYNLISDKSFLEYINLEIDYRKLKFDILDELNIKYHPKYRKT